MQNITSILEDGWTIAIIGGAIAAILAAIIINKFSKKDSETSTGSKQSNTQSTVVTNNINVSAAMTNKESKLVPSLLKNATSGEVALFKESAKVLFIDDLDLRDKIRNLTKAGWQNVSQIKDSINLDSKDIREANVIFVDYKGIGKPSKDQGLAVLTALRQRYKNTKWLILYSAHNVPVGAFNRGADSYLAKNSSVYELEQKIIEGMSNTES